MNLSELLNLIYLYENIFSLALKRKTNKFTPLQIMECDYTFYLLNSFVTDKNIEERNEREPNAVLTDEEVKELVTMLADRWQRVMNTNSGYTYDTENPANQLYSAFADSISQAVKISRMQLLMPTLRNVLHPITRMDARTDRSINQFVMSDDNHHLIHVDSALQQFKMAGVMQRTDDQGFLVELSESEMRRVTNHTQTTEKYFKILKSNQSLKIRPNTLGFRLQQLALGLKAASIEGEGTEFKAGGNADNAIIEFAALLNGLPIAIRADVMNSCFDNGNRLITFQYIWDALTDYRIRATNASLCTKNLADYIVNILDANLRFFNIQVSARIINIVNNNFSEHEKYIDKITSSYQEELNQNGFITSYEFPAESEIKFITSILFSEKGIAFFIKKKSNFQLFKKLDEENKNNCLSLLVQSEAGRDFLIRNKYPIETIPVFIPLNININEVQEESIDKDDLYQKEESSSEVSDSESIELHFDDQEVIAQDYDEDDAFAQAIAASLQSAEHEIIDISSDDEKGVNHKPEKETAPEPVDEKADKHLVDAMEIDFTPIQSDPVWSFKFKSKPRPKTKLIDDITPKIGLDKPVAKKFIEPVNEKADKFNNDAMEMEQAPRKVPQKAPAAPAPVSKPGMKMASLNDIFSMMEAEQNNIRNEKQRLDDLAEKRIKENDEKLKRKREEEKEKEQREAKRFRLESNTHIQSNNVTISNSSFSMNAHNAVSSAGLFASSSREMSASFTRVETSLPKAPPKKLIPPINVNLFLERCEQAQKWTERKCYLEALHFLKLAYDFIHQTNGLKADWCKSQNKRLCEKIEPLVKLFLGDGLEARLARYNNTDNVRSTAQWCRDAQMLIRLLFKDSKEDHFIRFGNVISVLKTATESRLQVNAPRI